MPSYSFSEYIFNTDTFTLIKGGTPTPLRPKAAKLLAFFITNKAKVVSKAAIAEEIWMREYVPDHTLFQLISELRRLSSETIICTHPNQGYSWVVSTQIVKKTQYRSSIMTALCATSLASLIMACVFMSPKANPPSLFPGHKAFLKGIVALDSGDGDKAVSWFTFALKENPDSVETRIFLAEGLFQQNRLKESLAQLEPIIRTGKATAVKASNYDRKAAKDLISRIHQKDGRLIEALKYAVYSNLGDGNLGDDSLESVTANCTEEHTHKRVKYLSNIVGVRPNVATGSPLSMLELGPSGEGKHYSEQCKQLQSDADNPSACTDTFYDSIYAFSELKRRLSIVS